MLLWDVRIWPVMTGFCLKETAFNKNFTILLTLTTLPCQPHAGGSVIALPVLSYMRGKKASEFKRKTGNLS